MSLIDQLDSDIDVMMSDLGVAVVFGSQQTVGLLDQPGQLMDMRSLGGVKATELALWYRTTSLSPAPTAKDAITVDGTGYTVREVEAQGDGRITKLMLKTA